MSVNIYGLNQLTRMPGGTLVESEAGLVVYRQSFVGRPSDVEAAFFTLVRRVSVNSQYPGLSLESKEIFEDEGEQHQLRLVWGGTASTAIGNSPVEQPKWSMKRSPRQEPITQHPEFKEFAGSLNSEENGAEFDPDTGLFLGFKAPEDDSEENRWGGVDSYLANAAVITKVSVYRVVPSALVNDRIPKINTPVGATFPIPSGGGRNYLKTDVSVNQIGAAFEIYEEWMLSNEIGWNPTLYE